VTGDVLQTKIAGVPEPAIQAYDAKEQVAAQQSLSVPLHQPHLNLVISMKVTGVQVIATA